MIELLLANYKLLLITSSTAFGSAGMYIFSDFKGFDNSKKFIRNQFPGHKKVFYSRIDFLLVVFTGTVIGLISFSPVNYYEALAAGFGWTGAMNVMMQPQRSNDN